jgi:pimeloyl-ACP methyl ester carboxylesterase
VEPSLDSSTVGVRHSRVDVGEVTLHLAETGQPGQPLVLLLHGFPGFWWSWRHQLDVLAAAGFRAAAPDLRGYNSSDKPRRVSDYHLEHLEADVAGLIRALGADRAAIVGHDWGAAVAWSFAQRHPAMVDRLVIMNVPHPERFRRGLWSPEQLVRSWYMAFFQLPAIPEWVLSRRDFQVLRWSFRRDGMPEEAIDAYVEAARAGEKLRGGLNYYRAGLRRMLRGGGVPLRPIEAPTLVIWGERDRFLGKELAAPDPRWVPDQTVERLPLASHWVQEDAPAQVNALLLRFLAPSRQ